MFEGLWNVGPTICRMTKAALKDRVGKNIFTYVDDIVVASKKKSAYISNMIETLVNMCEACSKLNLDKCVFVLSRGKVLNYLVLFKGIIANPDKI
jgi:hypothetical protein